MRSIKQEGPTFYGRFMCDAYHGGIEPPLATIDFGRRVRAVGVPGSVRYLCDAHAMGLSGWRARYRMVNAPKPMTDDDIAEWLGVE